MIRRIALALATLILLLCTADAALAGRAREVLEEDKYRFCHVEDYPLTRWEKRWCDYTQEGNSECPAFHKACLADNLAELPDLPDLPELDNGKGEGGPEQASTPPPPPPEPPRALSAVAQIVLIGLLAAGIAFLVWAILKNTVRDQKDDSLPPQPDEEEDAIEEQAAAARVVETDVQRLLRLANEAAQTGDFQGAIDHAYAASLRRLEGDQLIDMHESQTNGDYVRHLRRAKPELAGALRSVVRSVEQVQFGSVAPTASVYQTLLGHVMGIVGRAGVIVLLCVGLGANVACTDRGGQGGGSVFITHGGTRPSGSLAVSEMLAATGKTTRYRSKKLRNLGEEVDTLVILESGAPNDPEEWTELFRWVKEDGGLLILAGVMPPEDELDVQLAASNSLDAALRGAGDLQYTLNEAIVPPGMALVDNSYGADALLVRGEPALEVYAVKERRGRGEVVVLAEDALFSNASLAIANNAEIIFQMVRDRETIEFVDLLTGRGSDTPLEALNEARMTPLMLQLLALLALFMLWKGRAFGRLRDPRSHSRRSFADHVRALGTQYARANASGHALAGYAHWALDKLRDRVRGQRLNLDELAASIALRAQQPEDQVRGVLYAAQQASDAIGPPSHRVASTRDPAAWQRPDRAQHGDGLALMRQLDALLSALSQTGEGASASSPQTTTGPASSAGPASTTGPLSTTPPDDSPT